MKKQTRTRIGILGGGQLAQMLCTEGTKLGLEVHVLSESASDPAAQVTEYWHQGNPHDPKAIKKLSKVVSHLTFESEFIDATILQKLKKQNRKLQIFPSPEILGLLQDRREQKQLFNIFNLPTAFWLSFKKNIKISNIDELLWSLFPDGFVMKQRRNGYDGYGTFIFRNKKQWSKTKASLFKKLSLEDIIVEELIPFEKELALLVGRTKAGKFFHYPLVETFQTNAQCDWVKGPVKHAQSKKLLKQLEVFLKDLKYVGVMGVELFADKNGKLIVNEIAPRVHNSAHYSLTASSISQFAAHLLAGTTTTAPKIKNLAAHFAMANLLGKTNNKPKIPTNLKADLFWYGKKENRPRRKMGHLNMAGKSPRVLETVLKERQKIRL